MPIYEYRCDGCTHHMEKLQKISDEPLKTCPECGQDDLHKLISAAAFKLKGTGWYETDFKDKQPRSDGTSSSNSSPSNNSPNDADSKSSADSGSKATDNDKKSDHTKKETTKSSTSPSGSD